MEKKKPTVLPGLVNINTKPKVLAGIKKAADDFTGSALPIMKYFGDVKPSRDERIIKPDMTPGKKITKKDLPVTKKKLSSGFSDSINYRTLNEVLQIGVGHWKVGINNVVGPT